MVGVVLFCFALSDRGMLYCCMYWVDILGMERRIPFELNHYPQYN